jgi:hypothetical protein
MVFLATKLRRLPEAENPTFVIVTDRTDLDDQITSQFEGSGFPTPSKPKAARRYGKPRPVAQERRFLVKLRFSWRTTAQARTAFRQFFGVVPPPELDRLRTLTPADFALVRRRVLLTAQEGNQEVLHPNDNASSRT